MVKKVLYLDRIEQVRALMEPSRQQIIREMSAGATTSRQIAAAMGVSAPKIHYHLKELETHGLIRPVKKTQKGNLIETHYEPTARSFRSRTELENALAQDKVHQKDVLTRTLLVASSAIEDAIVEVVNLIEEADQETYDSHIHPTLLDNALNADLSTLRMSEEDYEEFQRDYHTLINRYKKSRAQKNKKAIDVFWVSFPNIDAARKACQQP